MCSCYILQLCSRYLSWFHPEVTLCSWQDDKNPRTNWQTCPGSIGVVRRRASASTACCELVSRPVKIIICFLCVVADVSWLKVTVYVGCAGVICRRTVNKGIKILDLGMGWGVHNNSCSYMHLTTGATHAITLPKHRYCSSHYMYQNADIIHTLTSPC